MDPLQLLADLEGLRDKIPEAVRGDFENLIASIRNIYEMSIKFVTPPQPVRDGKQNLASHHTTVDGLCTLMTNNLTSFKQTYTGQGSDAYHTTANASLQNLQLIRDHLATVSQLHGTMAINFDQATEAKIALVALLVGLGVTLAVLIGSAGTTAPVTVPAAVLEAAGGAVSIGLMTEAEAAAAAAIMALIWASLPEALLYGLVATGATDILGNALVHPITFNLPGTSNGTPNGSQTTINQARAHQNDLPVPGQAKGPYVYNPPKGARGDPSKAWDKAQGGFRDANGDVWVWDKLHNDHWDVQHKDGTYTNVRPDGTKGQGDPHHKR